MTQYYTDLTAVCPNPFLVRLVEQSAKGLGFNLVVAFADVSIDWAAVRVQYEALARSLKAGEGGASTEEATRRIFGLPPFDGASDFGTVEPDPITSDRSRELRLN
ncbi:hypothetical protein ACRAWC_09020 [Leifsonia sp. L25]|uniref:hypothetical protein n=1 Tax=Leifsonia sp. L25 TaxID=3423957 RepID=UPI003D68FFF1